MTSLTQLIASNVVYCLKYRGYDHHRTVALEHGLILVVYVDEAAAYHLSLRRLAPVKPSEAEVDTVLHHWPVESRPAVEPDRTRAPWTNKRTAAVYNCVSMSWHAERAEIGGKR
jgi:hypothetical protein